MKRAKLPLKQAPPLVPKNGIVLRPMTWVTERLTCSRTTVYSLMAAGKLEVVRHGRWVRFTERSVEQLIEDKIKQRA